MAVKFSKQRRVMEADPPSAALLDVFGECRNSLGCPVVGRVVQLYEQLVARKKRIINLVSVLDVVDGEIIIILLLLQPYLSGVNEWPVNALLLGKCDDVKL